MMYTVEYTAAYINGFKDTQRYSEVVWADNPADAIAQVQQIFNEEARLCDAEQGIPTMQWEAVYENVSVLERTAARVAELEQREPLAEMWRELEAYQEQADRDGHGESWARMCRERTAVSATHAASAASAVEAALAMSAAFSAANAVADVARNTGHAIAAIRKAKEVP